MPAIRVRSDIDYTLSYLLKRGRITLADLYSDGNKPALIFLQQIYLLNDQYSQMFYFHVTALNLYIYVYPFRLFFCIQHLAK